MCSPHSALSGLPGPGVDVAGVHFSTLGMGPGTGALGAAHGAGVLAFTGVGPGTLPLAVAGLASIAAGAAATVWGRDKHKVKRRRRKAQIVLPDLSHLADGVAA